MSHLLTLVFTNEENDSIEEKLDKYTTSALPNPIIIRKKEEIPNYYKGLIQMAKNQCEASITNLQEKPNILSERKLPELEALLEKYNVTMGLSDEQLYEKYRNGKSAILFDKSGNEVSMYNLLQKFDWYSVGGRWNNLIEGNRCYTKDIQNPAKLLLRTGIYMPNAVVLPDGSWHDEDDLEDSWEDFLKKTIKKAEEKNWFITVVDCHI